MKKVIKIDLTDNELHYFIISSNKTNYLDLINKIIKIYDQDSILIKNTEGKPFLFNSKINISISHSYGLLAVVVSLNSCIGIDIEKNFFIDGIDAISLLSVGEYKAIKDLDAISFNNKFFQLWCLKESYFKAKGVFDDVSDIYKHRSTEFTFFKVRVPNFTCIVFHSFEINKIINCSHFLI
jgi:phosphopantetheinyl transferase